MTDYTNEAETILITIETIIDDTRFYSDGRPRMLKIIAEALQAAERRGAEKMRQRAAKACDHITQPPAPPPPTPERTPPDSACTPSPSRAAS